MYICFFKKTRKTTLIKAKLNKTDGITNIDKNKITADEYHRKKIQSNYLIYYVIKTKKYETSYGYTYLNIQRYALHLT